MCSRSVSGSSLLSGYNEDDARETNGRSRREFDEIDTVLYNEEKAKRASIKKIAEEWSSRPHFRVRGRAQHIEKQSDVHLAPSFRDDATASSTFDLFFSSSKISCGNSHEGNVLLNDATSGRSSINSIEGSEFINNSDLDDTDPTNTILDDHSGETGADSFDSDEDDDDNHDSFSDRSPHPRVKQRSRYSRNPQASITCVKDTIVNSLAKKLLERLLSDQQPLLEQYVKLLYQKNSIKLRPKLRPNSLPPHPLSQGRLSYPSALNTQLQMTSTPYRSTPDPDMKGLLLVTRLQTGNTSSHTTISTSPRKPKIPPVLPAAERTPTSLAIDKRNQQQISLIGTAVANSSTNQLSMHSTSQNPTRQSSSHHRFRSASTVHAEPNTRLPPINIERLMNNDQANVNRTSTVSSGIIEAIPPATRAVSGTSIGSNPSSAVKLRVSATVSKLQRMSRPLSISSLNNNKDFNNLLSTSPTRSMAATPAPSSSLRATAVARTHHPHQKRPLITTRTRPPPSPSILKLSATHIW